MSSLLTLVCEGNTYNLLVQRNYFQKQSPIAYFQKCVLQICSKVIGGDPYGNAWVLSCNFAGDLQSTSLEEHLWGTGSVLYIICFGASNK